MTEDANGLAGRFRSTRPEERCLRHQLLDTAAKLQSNETTPAIQRPTLQSQLAITSLSTPQLNNDYVDVLLNASQLLGIWVALKTPRMRRRVSQASKTGLKRAKHLD